MSKITNLKFKEKDGDDNEMYINYVSIQVVENGYIITVTDADDEDTSYVVPYKDKDDVIKLIKSSLGI